MDILSGHGIYGESQGAEDMEAGLTGKRYSIEDLVQWWIEKEKDFRKSLIASSRRDHDLSAYPQKNEKENFHDLAKDLVRDRGATFFMQIWHCVRLSILQQYRTIAGLVLEIAVGTLGLMSFADVERF